ncbi:protease complex subunit PrcB family protein [Flavobacterium sp. W20_MBD1_R3]|uniref:protease complex subunit PrcB family protein n=1 Tax=Flavobacterium sp. W20_MBD1_R3 TaxID=3240278 RepID=UPI003F908A23
MKKGMLSILAITLASCSATSVKSSDGNVLYEVMTQQTTGGASIRFFEILSEPDEIKMLQNDENLKNKISANDVQNANFIVLNMGEKSSGGYAIGVENIVETDRNIIITIKETKPEPGSMAVQLITTPFCVVKINSKKEILIQ